MVVAGQARNWLRVDWRPDGGLRTTREKYRVFHSL